MRHESNALDAVHGRVLEHVPLAATVQNATPALCIRDQSCVQCRCTDGRVAAVEATVATVKSEWFAPDDSVSVIVLLVTDIIRLQ